MVQTYRIQSETWEKAYYEMNDKSQEFAKFQRERLSNLQKEIDAERVEWKRAVRKAKGPGFGVFAGVGHTGSGVEAVVGVGVVWKLF